MSAVPPGPPGPPQPQQAPPPYPGYGPPTASAPAFSLRVVLHVIAPVATILGLSLPISDTVFWAENPLWSVFAAVGALLQLTPVFGSSTTTSRGTLWTVGAIGVAMMLFHWVLITLPAVSSTNGFLLTVGAGAAAGASWLAPGRRI